MKRSVSSLVPWVMLSGLALLPGCKTSPEPARTEEQRTLPKGLHEIEEGSEDAYDHAVGGKAAALEADAKNLEAQWKEVRATVASSGAAPAALTAMDKALQEFTAAVASHTEAPALARAANAVSAPLGELFRPYTLRVPSDVLTLDYLGREEVLDARTGDFNRAASQLMELNQTWSALKGRVVAAGGQKAATDFEARLVEMQGAIAIQDAKTLESSANALLELVDDVEKAFER